MSEPKSIRSAKNKKWNEFWGEFLQVQFHQGHPDLWPSRERKVLWALKHFNLKTGADILDLGCGDGLIDIWLSRKGYQVTGVDRNAKVLEHAKAADDTRKVRFIATDLMEVDLPAEKFDAVLFLETSGLMSKEDEARLFKKIHHWLRPGGKLILDCPEVVELQNSWSREFPNGMARGVSSYDPVTRIQDIQFYFKPTNEEEFGIYDPYDPGKGDAEGIRRYLYPRSEIKSVLESAGFRVEGIDHYYEKNYFAVLGHTV